MPKSSNYPAPKSPIPKTLSQSIYSYLKEAIVENRLKANQKINEKEIASLFQVSITPVREAVLKLGAEGFLTVDSHREAVVREISYQELKEIFQVMSALEGLAVDLAFERFKPKDLQEIEEMTATMEDHVRTRSIEKYMELNVAIHMKIWKSVPNKFLLDTLSHGSEQMLRYNHARYYAYQKPGALERSMKEHEEILNALKEKDKKKLKALVEKHWTNLLQPSSFGEGLKESIQRNQKRSPGERK
ncbi:MAG: GntR family transcriptional regulator [Candidatus Aminicenantales bacterium]